MTGYLPCGRAFEVALLGNSTDLQKKISDLRPFILWAEMSGLLHDVGKLSSAFIRYRQTWISMPDGWDKDPHAKGFLTADHHTLGQFPQLLEMLRHPPQLSESQARLLDCPDGPGSVTEKLKAYSLERMVNEHTEPGDDPLGLLNMLKAADGRDTGIDRNNPLFTADQTGLIYNADVFGFEEKVLSNEKDWGILDDNRQALYGLLSALLPKYLCSNDGELRKKVFDVIEDAFDSPEAFSDTTRPNNDTSLWEHCYAVGSIMKALVLHWIIHKERLDDHKKVKFGLLGVGWDGMAFISRGHKIGDILGAQDLVEQLKTSIQTLVEYKYCLGNCIYQDDDGLVFLVPAHAELEGSSEYAKLLRDLCSEVDMKALELTQGDLQPKFATVEETTSTTSLIGCLRKLSERTAFPVADLSENLLGQLVAQWPQDAKAQTANEREVCPVCLRRPAKVRETDERGVCDVCLRRRRGAATQSTKARETPFLREIAQANANSELKRVALIVARFDLGQWLNGRMIRSLFIKEAHGLTDEIRSLPYTEQFRTDEADTRRWLEANGLLNTEYDWARLRGEIDRISRNDVSLSEKERLHAKHTTFLYHRHIVFDKDKKKDVLNGDVSKASESWKQWLEEAPDELPEDIGNPRDYINNLVCAKTPTPSTILDVWRTTQKFLERMQSLTIEKIESRIRARAFVPRPPGVRVDSMTPYEGRLDNSQVDVLWLSTGNDMASIIGMAAKECEEKLRRGMPLILDGKQFGLAEDYQATGAKPYPSTDSYAPVRTIISSPNLFLCLVPADRAVDITQAVHSEYCSRLGKVTGRLPLSIGNIFFDEKTPMFAVLDAARRMVRNFETLAEPSNGDHKPPVRLHVSKSVNTDGNVVLTFDRIAWPGRPPVAKSLEWRLPGVLGNGAKDYHHPYLVIEREESVHSEFERRRSYFKTVAGDVVHITDAEEGDTLLIYPNYYDFEFLDSTARRYDIRLEAFRRRSSVTAALSKPCLLDEFEQDLVGLWDGLTSGDTKSITPGLTDTKLRNIESLWLAKLQEWHVNLATDCDRRQQWQALVEATLMKEWPQTHAKSGKLREAILSGLFFDCLELHLRVLKERIERTSDGEARNV